MVIISTQMVNHDKNDVKNKTMSKIYGSNWEIKTYTFSIQIWNSCDRLGKNDDGKQQKYMILTL